MANENILKKAQKIKLLLLDVDGVLTDGRLFLSDSGEEIKAFNTLDGQGIKMLQKSGVQVGIITGRESTLVAARSKNLGINLLKQGREDKYTALEELRRENESLGKIELEEIAFMGDDYPDLLVMTRVGFAASVPSAAEAVKAHSHYITTLAGGEGAVREICDFIMRAQGTFDKALAQYLLA